MKPADAEQVKQNLLQLRKLYDESKDPAERDRILRSVATFRDIFRLNDECLEILRELNHQIARENGLEP